MRRIIWSLVEPLFLHEEFAYRTKLPGDATPQLYQRVTLIPAPGPEMIIGMLLGGLSGVLLEFTLSRQLTSVLPLWAIIVIPGAWEALQNARHIGGKQQLPHFNVEEHRKWYRVDETRVHPEHLAKT